MDDAVWCWGSNTWGQLGNGTFDDSDVPVQVVRGTGMPLRGVTAISAGGSPYGGHDHNCVVAGGTIECWGGNDLGQLGDGTLDDSNVPVQVAGLQGGGQTIAAGDHVSCGVVDGSVRCWGSNFLGALGSTSLDTCSDCYSPTPVQVGGLPAGVSAIDSGGRSTCVIAGGDIWCWGDASFGQLGYPGGGGPTPGKVNGVAVGAQAISQGGQGACAIVDGWVYCWGNGNYVPFPVQL